MFTRVVELTTKPGKNKQLSDTGRRMSHSPPAKRPEALTGWSQQAKGERTRTNLPSQKARWEHAPFFTRPKRRTGRPRWDCLQATAASLVGGSSGACTSMSSNRCLRCKKK